jgi:DNA polymerase-3 subunit epsilon
VLAATAEEIAAHEAVLDGIEKEARTTAVWRVSTATAESTPA